jgi:hypothetical protein
MMTRRPSAERGHFDHGWLDTRHSFSFADYRDPAHMGFRALRVINEDRVQPARGFPTHSHRDMEILSWVLDGALEHKDSLGNGSVIRPGDIQRMSAGTGVQHSEFNPSPTEPMRLLQIWILPERSGLEPGYEEKHFTPRERTDRLRLVASRDAREGSVKIHQDLDLYASILPAGKQLQHTLKPGRHAWIQVARGELLLNDTPLGLGDGAAVSDESELELQATADAELLLFDLA